MTHHEEPVESIRRGLGVLVEEAPIAPEFDSFAATPLEWDAARRPTWAVVFYAAAGVIVIVGGVALVRAGGGPAPSEPLAQPMSSTTMAQPLAPTTEPAPDPTSTSIVEEEAPEFPYLVLDASGWEIEHMAHMEGPVPTGEDTSGRTPQGRAAALEVQWVSGGGEAQMNIETGGFADLDSLILDREASGTRIDDAVVLGVTAVVLRYDGDHTAMWSIEDDVYEFRANLGEEEFRSLLSSLKPVEREEWVDTLPDTIVTDRPAAVAEYLRDIPVPDGLDTTTLGAGFAEHWYFVGADVVSAVSCGWIDQWGAGKAAGDEEAMTEAIDAMATSRDWGILIEMDQEGGFSSVIWEYADAIAGDGTVVGGRVLTVEESYENALGCYRR